MSLAKLSNQELVKDYYDSQTDIAICRVALVHAGPDEYKKIAGRKRKNELYMEVIARELGERGALELVLT